jgi:hypothetical protein
MSSVKCKNNGKRLKDAAMTVKVALKRPGA